MGLCEGLRATLLQIIVNRCHHANLFQLWGVRVAAYAELSLIGLPNSVATYFNPFGVWPVCFLMNWTNAEALEKLS